MLALARALGWPFQTLQLSWNPLNHLPNPLLGATASTLDHQADKPVPPWPDLVIAASRRSAPVARWIKRQSGGRTRLVHLLHAQMPLHHFDLIFTLAQYRLPRAANVYRNTLPLNIVDSSRKSETMARWRDKLTQLPRPWTAVLVGGDSSSYTLDATTATRLGAYASQMARQAGGSLWVTTSRRTSAEASQALTAGIDCQAHIHRWQPHDPDNPYAAFLALADQFIVTGDSASLPTEAAASGKPVWLFEWPPDKPIHQPPPGLRSLHDWAVYNGWLKPRRDFAAFHQRLRDRGLVDTNRPACPPPDMDDTVKRIKTLFAH